MKKALSVVVASVATLALLTGCSATTGASSDSEMSAHLDVDASICKTAIYIGNRSNKKVIKAIESAGEKNEWKITHFKANAVIAEKVIDGKTLSTTIEIAKEHINCSKNGMPQNELDTLRTSIVEEIKKGDMKQH
ncbi:MAG: hypothetical protein AABY36_05845 [Campylobacterota bacterium]